MSEPKAASKLVEPKPSSEEGVGQREAMHWSSGCKAVCEASEARPSHVCGERPAKRREAVTERSGKAASETSEARQSCA